MTEVTVPLGIVVGVDSVFEVARTVVVVVAAGVVVAFAIVVPSDESKDFSIVIAITSSVFDVSP